MSTAAIGLALLGGGALLKYGGSLWNVASALWNKLPALPALSSGKAATPSYADAMNALSVLARFKSQSKDAPEYAMVLAALKTMEAA